MNVNPLTAINWDGNQNICKLFPLQYQYNINQISDENRDKHQFGDN